MARNNLKFEIENLDRFMKTINKLEGQEARKQFSLFLEKAGFDLLDVIQNTIISMQVVDTRRLLNSFDKGGEGNIWEFSDGGLTLTVGTNVEYARAVNDGHWTVGDKYSFIMKDGTKARWVPGVWRGNKFQYIPDAKTGMLIKRKWVEGRPYWDTAVKIYEAMFQKDFQQFVNNWLEKEW